jgi:hypothetical protein
MKLLHILPILALAASGYSADMNTNAHRSAPPANVARINAAIWLRVDAKWDF